MQEVVENIMQAEIARDKKFDFIKNVLTD